MFPEPATDLTITVGLVAEMTVINPFDLFVEEYAERSGFAYRPEAQDLEPYLRPIDDNPLLSAWLGDHPELTVPGRPIVGFLIGLNRQIAGDVAYSVRMEPGVQSPDTTLQRAVGSCRDSAWMLVAAMRELGMAARFVSGHLVQLAPDAVPGVTPPTFDSDFTDLHAWAEVYIRSRWSRGPRPRGPSEQVQGDASNLLKSVGHGDGLSQCPTGTVTVARPHAALDGRARAGRPARCAGGVFRGRDPGGVVRPARRAGLHRRPPRATGADAHRGGRGGGRAVPPPRWRSRVGVAHGDPDPARAPIPAGQPRTVSPTRWNSFRSL